MNGQLGFVLAFVWLFLGLLGPIVRGAPTGQVVLGAKNGMLDNGSESDASEPSESMGSPSSAGVGWYDPRPNGGRMLDVRSFYRCL